MSAPNAAKIKSFAVTLALIGAAIVLVGLVYLFFTPKSYLARSRVQVTDWVHSADANEPMNLAFMTTECDLIRSNALVDLAIQHLGLAEDWSKRYHPGVAANMDETRARLRSKMRVRQVANSSLIEIAVFSEDPDETSRIANELARIYVDYRQAQREALIRAKVGEMMEPWDDQNKKIKAAQAVVDKLYFEISQARSTNLVQLYDPDAYEAVLRKRIEVEGQYVSQKKQFDQLKQLGPDELIQVLSTVDENSALTGPLEEFNKAKSTLLKAQLEHGPDSGEVKTATKVVADLDQKIRELVATTMKVKETDLGSLQSALETLDQKIKHASTNAVQESIQDTNYRTALANLSTLKQERDDLQKRMNDIDSAEATRPTGITARLIDAAEPPRKPFIPDGKAAAGILTLGGCAMVIAIILLLTAQSFSRVPAKKPA